MSLVIDLLHGYTRLADEHAHGSKLFLSLPEPSFSELKVLIKDLGIEVDQLSKYFFFFDFDQYSINVKLHEVG